MSRAAQDTGTRYRNSLRCDDCGAVAQVVTHRHPLGGRASEKVAECPCGESWPLLTEPRRAN